MDYKDEIIGEICDNAEYWEVLDLLDMTDVVDDAFEFYLSELSDEDLIDEFEYHCYDYDEFLEIKEMDLS